MDLKENGWMLAAGALLLLFSSGLRRALGTTLQWLALAAFLYGVYQAITLPFDQGVSRFVTWAIIATVGAVASRILSPPSPGQNTTESSRYCSLCRNTGWIACDHALAGMTGSKICLECGGSGQKRCPHC